MRFLGPISFSTSTLAYDHSASAAHVAIVLAGAGFACAMQRIFWGEEAKEPVEERTLPKLTWSEISQHTSPESLWVVVRGKVFDVTKFLPQVK